MKNLLLIIAFLFSSQFAQAQEIPAQVHEDSIGTAVHSNVLSVMAHDEHLTSAFESQEVGMENIIAASLTRLTSDGKVLQFSRKYQFNRKHAGGGGVCGN